MAALKKKWGYFRCKACWAFTLRSCKKCEHCGFHCREEKKK